MLFLFKVDSEVYTFLYTDSLSQNMLVGPSIGMPKTRNLYRRSSTNSVAVLRAMNSLENVLVSKVFCFLLYHSMGVLLKNSRTPVWDLLVALFLACSESTKECVDTTFTLGVEASASMASLASR